MTGLSFKDAHAVAPAVLLSELNVDAHKGLSAEEARQRFERDGPNSLPRVKRRSPFALFLDQFRNVIVLLLAAAAVISWLTGDRIEGMAIVVVLLLNGAIGFGMEWQAGRALAALRKQTQITANVVRDGRVAVIAAESLVVGDIVRLSAGDRVPADLRVLESAALRAEESPLTGESKSVFKSAGAVGLDALIAERSSMLFLGTVITAGTALAFVVATGERTELGKIGRLVTGVQEELTPLQRKLNALGKRLAWLVIAIGGVVALAGWIRGDELWTMLEVGISLAVAAVPEALPAATTFIFAFGVVRMARQKALVRRLAAVETLGSTSVICTDKTGTLTLNRMKVSDLVPDRRDLLVVIALCNEATRSTGDPTEIALVEAVEERGIDVEALRSRFPRVREYPFDSQTKRMLTIHRTPESRLLWALKGAPDVVLDACTLRGEQRRSVEAENAQMASRGLRVLAAAQKLTPVIEGSPDSGFEFVGLVGMLDPPREGVKEAVARTSAAGIRVIMLTGDQADTAEAIARELRIGGDDPRVAHARDLQRSDPLALVARTDVFARVSPEDKFRIVEALQNEGEVVAVTGDGVNDAPALKKADVGVAMGERGTEVTKEASDIVLADDNFTTIVSAIEGGRTIYANITKFVHAMFSHNLSEVLVVFTAIILGWPLPLLPLQILWINLVTDVFPAFALALEPPADDVMRRPPRARSESLLSRRFLFLIGWQAAVLAVVALCAYRWALQRYGDGDHARTMAMLAVIVVQLGQTFNCRSRTRSSFRRPFSNPHIWYAAATVVLIQVAAFLVPRLRDVLHLTPLDAAGYGVLAAAGIVPVIVVELYKFVTAISERQA